MADKVKPELRTLIVKHGETVPVRPMERLIAMDTYHMGDGVPQGWRVLLGPRWLIEDRFGPAYTGLLGDSTDTGSDTLESAGE